MNRLAGLYGVMAVLGLCWGLGIPMGKAAVSTGFHPFAVVAWQSIYMAIFLTVILVLTRGRFPLARRHWGLYLAVAVFGTLIPNTTSYTAAAHLPAGVMAIVIAMVPMFSLPIAIGLGMERWQWHRASGLILGAIAVILLAGPETALPEGTALVFLALALVAPFFYGSEGNWLAHFGTGGLSPLEVLWGASVLGVLVSVPWALASGNWIPVSVSWDAARWAILVSSITHGIAYTGYVWLVGQAGSVFSAQVSYLVTAAGVLWSVTLLGERYGGAVWLAFVLMMVGVALVQPRDTTPTADQA